MDLVSGKPMKLSSAQDSPEFGFPQTFNSRQELNQAMPGHSFEVFEELPKSSQALAKASPEINAQVAAILGGVKPTLPSVEKVSKQELVAAPAASSPSLAFDKAQDILKRLEFAVQYASSKNKKDIQLRLAILEEAFSEIFS
jgi:hypothetical protein